MLFVVFLGFEGDESIFPATNCKLIEVVGFVMGSTPRYIVTVLYSIVLLALMLDAFQSVGHCEGLRHLP